jgi:V-type H+-transporting ATPase subunit F
LLVDCFHPKNILETPLVHIEETFREFTIRKDIAVVLINQHIANDIRHLVDAYANPLPAVLEIPSKDKPYDASKDSVLKRAQRIFGNE